MEKDGMLHVGKTVSESRCMPYTSESARLASKSSLISGSTDNDFMHHIDLDSVY